MRKKLVVWGISELSEMISWYLKSDDSYEIIGYTLDDDYVKQESFLSKPMIQYSELKNITDTPYEVLVTTGYGQMNNVRKQIIERLKSSGVKIADYIHPSSLVYSSKIGIGNIILENCSVGAFTEIGDGNIIYPSTTLAHHSKVGNYNFFSVECAIAGHVNIGNNCFFGVNCTVKNDITISDYTLVGAAAYINRDTDKYGVYTPARSQKLDKSSMDIKI